MMVALSIVVGVLVLWCIAVTLQTTQQAEQIRKLRGKLKLVNAALEDHEKRMVVLEELPPCVSSLGKVKKESHQSDDFAEALLGGIASGLAEDENAPPFLRKMGAMIFQFENMRNSKSKGLSDLSDTELMEILAMHEANQEYEDARKITNEIERRQKKA
jgi:hypothetical protein